MNTVTYQKARAQARRLPSWFLRRKVQRIVDTKPRPSDDQLETLGAYRRELIRRRTHHGWWP